MNIESTGCVPAVTVGEKAHSAKGHGLKTLAQIYSLPRSALR